MQLKKLDNYSGFYCRECSCKENIYELEITNWDTNHAILITLCDHCLQILSKTLSMLPKPIISNEDTEPVNHIG